MLVKEMAGFAGNLPDESVVDVYGKVRSRVPGTLFAGWFRSAAADIAYWPD